MLDLIREAPLGKAIRFVSRNKFLQYPEERPDFELPVQYLHQLKHSEKTSLGHHDSHANGALSAPGHNRTLRHSSLQNEDSDLEALGMVQSAATIRTAPYSTERMRAERELEVERRRSVAIIPQTTSDGAILVDWYATDDPENPQNWSSGKKAFVVAVLCIYTWTVYCAGPIYATAEEELWSTSESAPSLPPWV